MSRAIDAAQRRFFSHSVPKMEAAQRSKIIDQLYKKMVKKRATRAELEELLHHAEWFAQNEHINRIDLLLQEVRDALQEVGESAKDVQEGEDESDENDSEYDDAEDEGDEGDQSEAEEAEEDEEEEGEEEVGADAPTKRIRREGDREKEQQ